MKHEPGCYRGEDCVECGGCECGLIQAVCTGPGCWSIDDYDLHNDELGMTLEEGSYG